MRIDPYRFPHPSRRYPVYAARGMVATSQTLASRAGLSMLERGGNAVDAALAAAISLTVVEPTSNGLGSDAFAIVWSKGSPHGVNGSGRRASRSRRSERGAIPPSPPSAGSP
jgi:gamma-glutamyltranspeptidase/glutathione hydrolase